MAEYKSRLLTIQTRLFKALPGYTLSKWELPEIPHYGQEMTVEEVAADPIEFWKQLANAALSEGEQAVGLIESAKMITEPSEKQSPFPLS